MAHHPVSETRAALIRAALAIIGRDGVEAATTRAIAAEAGLALASFHYAFRSRDELMAELIRTAVDEEDNAISPGYADESFDPATAPTAYQHAQIAFHAYVDSLIADPDREKAMLALTMWAVAKAETRPLAAIQYSKYDTLARSAVEAVTALTGVRWRMPLDEVSRFVVVLSDGITLSWLIHNDAEQTHRMADAAARALLAQAVSPGDYDYDTLPEPGLPGYRADEGEER
ncbi:TetR family transcriptional regulator [Gryllotalpicola sp.]|uniref:TetR/AcrR family transcriptional regulator n=1 Tax=Gryllotalpicola sp. TaxID=1932787 RepID=UPI002637CA2B|nr:TetR family transcriptional regulator [Gryllotalpicola sp.]